MMIHCQSCHQGLIVGSMLSFSLVAQAEPDLSNCSVNIATGNVDSYDNAIYNFAGYSVTRFATDFIPASIDFEDPGELESCPQRPSLELGDVRVKITPDLRDDQIGNNQLLRYIVAMWIWNDQQEHGWNSFNKLSIANYINCYNSKSRGDSDCRVHVYFTNYRRYKPIPRPQLNAYIAKANKEISVHKFSDRIEKLLREAAIHGYVPAQFALAKVLEDGVGVPINFVEAQAWRNIAASQEAKLNEYIRTSHLFRNILTDEEKQSAQLLAEKYQRELTSPGTEPSFATVQ